MTLRERLYERCRGYCEKCGWPLGTNWAMHHRVLQSRVDDIRNVLALGHDCHNGKRGSVHLSPINAIYAGYIVRQPEGTDDLAIVTAAASTPVLLHGNKWVLLTEQSTYRYLAEERDHAAP